MTPSSRLLIVFSLLGALLLPVDTLAQETGSGSETGSGTELTDSGALLEMQRLQAAEDAKWAAREERTAGFWAAMMNNRKTAAAHREQQEIRRQKRIEKRIACREDVRRANRDAIESVTFNCFRAMLTLDLEMLRKDKQFAETMAGPTQSYRASALFHIGNLMDAISTIVQAMDAGVYSGEEGLLEAKQNLNLSYRANRRLAMTHLRVDRTVTWAAHLMIRLRNVLQMTPAPPPEAMAKLEAAIACLEQKQELLQTLLVMEDNKALITQFRQAQSELKFCHDLVLEAQELNTEFEQAEAENEES